VIILIAAAFAYEYETSNSTISGKGSTISSLNGQVSSYQAEVSSLNANITHQLNAEDAMLAKLTAANATIASQTSALGSYSTQVRAQQSTIELEVQQTLTYDETLDMPYNSTTTVTHFTVNSGGYLQISGTSSTFIAIGACYGATSLAACNTSTSYYLLTFGYGGGTYDVPLEPGPVWVFAGNLDPGTATLTVVLLT